MSAFLRSRTGVVLVAFLGIAAFFLITEHTAHVFGVLPYALLLLCPLLHVFMHHGHGGTPATTKSIIPRETNDELACLWPLAARGRQLGGVHHLRLQLHAPAHQARLALVRRVLRLRGGPLHRNVRLPVDDLFALGMAQQPLPGR